MFCADNLKGQVGPPRQKVAVLRDQGVGTDPFCVSCDEGISRFQPQDFVFGPQLKGNNKIFIKSGKGLDKSEKSGKDFRRKISADFLRNKTGDSNRMSGIFFNQEIKQFFRVWIPAQTKAEKVFV